MNITRSLLLGNSISRCRPTTAVAGARSFSAHHQHHNQHHHHQSQTADSAHVHLDLNDITMIRHQAVSMLQQKISVVKMLNNNDFVKKSPTIYNSSVASHIRHSLDHFHAIIKAAEEEKHFADYDTRSRNTDIEKNRDLALEALEKAIYKVNHMDLTQAIQVSFIGDDKTFQTFKMSTYVGRELAFAAHHSIHHMTMVKLIMMSMQYEFNEDSTVGVAPSTTKDMQLQKEKGDQK